MDTVLLDSLSDLFFQICFWTTCPRHVRSLGTIFRHLQRSSHRLCSLSQPTRRRLSSPRCCESILQANSVVQSRVARAPWICQRQSYVPVPCSTGNRFRPESPEPVSEEWRQTPNHLSGSARSS